MHWWGVELEPVISFAIESIGCLSGGSKQSPFWQEAVCKAEAVNSYGGGNLDISYRVESVNFLSFFLAEAEV